MNEKEKRELLKSYRQACRVLNSAGIKIKRMTDEDILWTANRQPDGDIVRVATFVVKYRGIVKEIL
jgi:hypothetical protein